MEIIKLIIFFFIVSAIAIGTQLVGTTDLSTINIALDNASTTITNINIVAPPEASLGKVDISGLYVVLEKYLHFIGALVIETMRTGIKFGYNNPGYFDPVFVFKIIRFILIVFIISIIIKPLMYLCVFIFMIGLWIKDKFKKSRKNNKKHKEVE